MTLICRLFGHWWCYPRVAFVGGRHCRICGVGKFVGYHYQPPSTTIHSREGREAFPPMPYPIPPRPSGQTPPKPRKP